eukprot:CAMPEP_0194266552 /NCGR_PEP_ID=MMETSP0169-20130528/1416_1 /TAXON_ID=218684 /ORGANISM="Corethron pennatum, Strain L29A3" /LENGTH=317 /DNA_ID=CAMNT_0039007257 /DNA_START=243 /DNA_END=1196 /DNA_ORIENTATION=+
MRDPPSVTPSVDRSSDNLARRGRRYLRRLRCSKGSSKASRASRSRSPSPLRLRLARARVATAAAAKSNLAAVVRPCTRWISPRRRQPPREEREVAWGATVRHGGPAASARSHGNTNLQLLAVQREEEVGERSSPDRPDPRPAAVAPDESEELYNRIMWQQKSEKSARGAPVRSDHASFDAPHISEDVPTDCCCPCLPLSGPWSTLASLPSMKGFTEEADIECGAYADFASCHTELLDTVTGFTQGMFPVLDEQRQVASEERSAPQNPGWERWFPGEWEQRVSPRPDVSDAVVVWPATTDGGKKDGQLVNARSSGYLV